MVIMLLESKRLNHMGITPKKIDCLSINIYSLIIHLDISIQNISLVLSCEPQPNCRLKATDNCLNTLCVMYAILATAVTSITVSPWWKHHIPKSLVFVTQARHRGA